MVGHVSSLGFLGTPRAGDAEFLIGQTQHLVATLDPTGTALRPAQLALNTAKALHAAQDYARAVAQAERAATLAVTLNDRFTSYVAAWKELQACRDELKEIGIPTDRLEAALAAADQEVAHPVDDHGAVVPNYLGAMEVLERAVAEGRISVAEAREASREIFLATLAVEALSDSQSKQAPSWMSIRLEQMVEQATQELALGRLSAAHLIAAEARARADDTLAGAARAWDRLDLVAAILDGLGADGPLAATLATKVEAAKEALARGVPDRASTDAIVRQISDEVASFAKQYPGARKLLEAAERVDASFRREGFVSPEVAAALTEARFALGSGAWSSMHAKVAFVSETFAQLRRDQQILDRAVAEFDERVNLLRGFRLPLLPEVEIALSRVREATRSGRISAAKEELVLASTIMVRATRTGS